MLYVNNNIGFESVLGHLKPQSSPEVQEEAAAGVVKRLIPDKANLFNVRVDPNIGPAGKDTFKVCYTNWFNCITTLYEGKVKRDRKSVV